MSCVLSVGNNGFVSFMHLFTLVSMLGDLNLLNLAHLPLVSCLPTYRFLTSHVHRIIIYALTVLLDWYFILYDALPRAAYAWP